MRSVEPRTNWTFVTHHARILAMIFKEPETRLRDMAEVCGITERAAGAIVSDLEGAGYLTRARNGRRNHYKVTPGTLFRHPAEGPHEVADLLLLLVGMGSASGGPGADDDQGEHQARDRRLAARPPASASPNIPSP
ncbi:MarR family winged helix-turn-helix transcriptional regulator [Streptomyces sp. NPDC051771]|uniref:MarR family winged helix-turn-helix transcriptional regulator n=1 Tax=Streptomyces sp. NPDC051771 TaxID=3154847 RepID=UPI0034475E90